MIPNKNITDSDYADDIALLANTPAQTETLLHSMEWVADGIGLHFNADKTEYMCFYQRDKISTLNGSSLKQLDMNRKWHQHAISKGMDSHP